ncbi:glycosyltransferase [uncultured Croceitalea sp.]|uniref:glycosyltransferase n=1 Tax=uncultured Croceitalea sp. TaxID=1798908 RepID=UPI00374F2484
MKDFVIIVPCYNEANRLPIKSFSNFLAKEKEVSILFVNDASTDNTIDILNQLESQYQNQVSILENSKNKGKAESIRNGVLYALEKDPRQLAYLDADLATSLEECYSYNNYLIDGKEFVFASRILKIGSVVERKFSRFFFGRIIATIISNILDIKVYDTQCGCKVFTKRIAELIFQKPFISKWLFDVELFSRILNYFGKEKALNLMNEIPVKRWVDIGDSKVKMSYFFQLWIDLYKIQKTHNTK